MKNNNARGGRVNRNKPMHVHLFGFQRHGFNDKLVGRDVPDAYETWSRNEQMNYESGR